jgi:hypothetical protein
MDVGEVAAEICREDNGTYAEGCSLMIAYKKCEDSNCGDSYCDRECADASVDCEFNKDCYFETEHLNHTHGDAMMDYIVKMQCEGSLGQANGNCTQLFWNVYSCSKGCTPSDCIADTCSNKILACINSTECQASVNATLQGLANMNAEDNSPYSMNANRRRLGMGYTTEDQKSFAESLILGVDPVDFLGYPAIYFRWYYTFHCKMGNYCDADLAALLDCAVNGCAAEVARVNECLGVTCYDDVISCFNTTQCGQEYTDVVLYYSQCDWNSTAGLCGADLKAYGNYTTYVQYTCWRDGGCSNEYRTVFGCMENCAMSYIQPSGDYCMNCDGALMDCFWNATCWNALATTVSVLTQNDSYSAHMWITDNILNVDPYSLTPDYYHSLFNDLVCQNAEYTDVTCNDMYWAVIDCAYDKCVLPSVPCQITGCSKQLLSCVEQTKCSKELDVWVNNTAHTSLNMNSRRLLHISDFSVPDLNLMIPTFSSETDRQLWLNSVFTDTCNNNCSSKFVTLMDCFSKDCTASNPVNNNSTDGSQGGGGSASDANTAKITFAILLTFLGITMW